MQNVYIHNVTDYLWTASIFHLFSLNKQVIYLNFDDILDHKMC